MASLVDALLITLVLVVIDFNDVVLAIYPLNDPDAVMSSLPPHHSELEPVAKAPLLPLKNATNLSGKRR
jgi:hypothetical protein